jgi:hypothetical protein
MKAICPKCNIRPKKKHLNAKWCSVCAEALKKQPVGRLTPSQERKVRRLAGTMLIDQLAKEVGSSNSNLDRWARQNGVDINGFRYPPKLVQDVCEYYVKHGKIKTQKKFPHVKVRSIVERYAHEPRQVRWKPGQLIALVKIAGLISHEDQALFFNRPNAQAGSIKSAWMKIFKSSGGSINGLSHWMARHFVKFSCPYYETGYWVAERGLTKQRRTIALWVDVAAHLRPDVPDHLASAIHAMAKFQRWVHGRDCIRSIQNILEGNLNGVG